MSPVTTGEGDLILLHRPPEAWCHRDFPSFDCDPSLRTSHTYFSVSLGHKVPVQPRVTAHLFFHLLFPSSSRGFCLLHSAPLGMSFRSLTPLPPSLPPPDHLLFGVCECMCLCVMYVCDMCSLCGWAHASVYECRGQGRGGILCSSSLSPLCP